MKHTSPLARLRSLRSRLMFGAPLALSCAAALGACANVEPRDLGFTQSAQDLGIPPTEPFFGDTSQFVGRWVGSAEDVLALTADGSPATYRFPSGSSRILVELHLDEYAGLVGSITFGEGPPLPAVTDPDAGYPEGLSYDELLGYPVGDEWQGTPFGSPLRTHYTLPPFEGFAHTLDYATSTVFYESGRVLPDGVASLHFSTFEPLGGWCALQTPYERLDFPNQFSCIPSSEGGSEVQGDGTGAMCKLYGAPGASTCREDASNFPECHDEGEVVAQVNCDKLTMCLNNFCRCISDGCFATDSNDRLTVRRVGDELVGLLENINFKNLRGLGTPLGQVRLQRAE